VTKELRHPVAAGHRGNGTQHLKHSCHTSQGLWVEVHLVVIGEVHQLDVHTWRRWCCDCRAVSHPFPTGRTFFPCFQVMSLFPLAVPSHSHRCGNGCRWLQRPSFLRQKYSGSLEESNLSHPNELEAGQCSPSLPPYSIFNPQQ